MQLPSKPCSALFIHFFKYLFFQRLAYFPALKATFFFGLISKYEEKNISPTGYEVGQTVSG